MSFYRIADEISETSECGSHSLCAPKDIIRGDLLTVICREIWEWRQNKVINRVFATFEDKYGRSC